MQACTCSCQLWYALYRFSFQQIFISPTLISTLSCFLIVYGQTSKYDRFSLLSHLPSALKFAKLNLSKGKKLLVCCPDGEDISVCVSLAILTSLFDNEGLYNSGKSFTETCISKWDMRKRLVFICKFATNARPSRGNLRQVFNFLNKDGCISSQ